MATTGSCWEADDTFGPRVSVDCRGFDFTLLFEDIFLTLLPAACFLFLIPFRLRSIQHATIKLNSYTLAVCKLLFLAILLVFQVLLTVFEAQSAALRTRAFLPSAIIGIVATLAAMYGSFIEDQRSVRPSDLLVLYFSATTICQLPRLRSLWLIPSVDACRYIAVVTLLCTIAVVMLESVPKTKVLRHTHDQPTKEQRSSFWSRTLFLWVLPFLRIGYQKALGVDDIPQVDASLQGQVSGDRLKSAWKPDRKGSKFRLVKAVVRAYGFAFIAAMPPRLALSCFTFTQPFLITAAIGYIGGSSVSEPRVYGLGLVGAYVLVYLGIAVAKAAYWRQTYRFLTMVRAGLISIIYDTTMIMNAVELNDSAAITLMGTDVERIVANLKNVHEAWASIIEVGVAIWLLERQLGIACFIPLVISLVSVIAMIPVSNRSGEAQKQWIERVQKRLEVTIKSLRSMKVVQMLGLNDVLLPLVSYLREVEVMTSVRFRKLLIWQVALSNIPVAFAPFATFTIYALIALVQPNTTIHSAQAFASLALISLMTGPRLLFCQAMPALWQAIACFERIQAYCKQTSLFTDEEAENHSSTHEKFSSFLLSFENANIAWSSDKQSDISSLRLDIPRGVTMIVGPVGCGKSTLIEAILDKNMTPWIINDTIRNNITGFQGFDSSWYNFVCTACGLKEDLDNFEQGDLHLAGSDGIALSGGQKQRIALARAVYSRLSVVVLDNVLSGIDSKNIARISRHLFGPDGYFRRAGTSVIMVTTMHELLPLADAIVMMDQGEVVASGSYDEIISKSPQVSTQGQKVDGYATPATSIGDKNHHPTYPEKKEYPKPEASTAVDKCSIHIARQGTWCVYKYYARSAGYGLVVAFLALTFIEAFCNSFQALWISWWVKANEIYPNKQLKMCLGVYGMIFGLTFVTMVLGCWLLFVRVLNNTSLNLHADLLRTALWAPIGFFQRVDTGSITNRFSQDLELIDMMLPIYAVNCVMNVMEVCINIIIISSYYLRTSRQVRLLDIEAKAPLYTHFLETIRGISSIQSYNWEGHLRKKANSLLNQSQRPVYMIYSLQQWLTLVLDLAVGAIAVVLIAVITTSRDDFQDASIGVALNLILTLNQSMANAIKMWTMTEVSIGAVTRVLRFTQDTPSEEGRCLPLADANLPPGWPDKGTVEIVGLAAGYDHSTIPILKNLSISIRPGEKIAVCGPSGSGKTSFIMAVLQMLELQAGQITIDGQDLSQISRSTLRSRINVIPQEPYLIPGATLGFNLDPRAVVEDKAEIIRALEKVGLWDRVRAKGGLEMQFTAGDWSAGQKQLLALARAIVLKRQVLILDEATSSVDSETESSMQKIIETEFSQQTVIAVVHRFRYIHWFDRVVVLKKGELVECGSAAALLQRKSEFWKLYLA
ncbi:hypothetical protein BDV06DRAFT_230810 [Aspergillus oleicola]